LRLAVYTDDEFSDFAGGIYARRAFTLFVDRLSERVDEMVVVGRLREGGEIAHYRLADRIRFVGLPYYESLGSPLSASRGFVRSMRRFWRVLEDVDGCWLLGPHPHSIAFAFLAILRRKRVVLGVRQDLPEYARTRHPGRIGVTMIAWALEGAYRLLARRFATVVVGPALRHRYRASRRLLEIAVSLVEPEQIIDPATAAQRSYSGKLTILSVGRVDEEKNPLMLADVLARLDSEGGGWRLVVIGEGGLERALRDRLEALNLSDRASIRGYVEQAALAEVYRDSHVLLLTSRTEGLPQVLIEAFAAGLPVVSTDVGGIREAVGQAVVLIEPESTVAAAEAVRRVAEDPALRRRLITAGHAYVQGHTIEAEIERVVGLLSSEIGGASAAADSPSPTR
jgi:glycosyltransferase involved in cell wall biosynthesis